MSYVLHGYAVVVLLLRHSCYHVVVTEGGVTEKKPLKIESPALESIKHDADLDAYREKQDVENRTFLEDEQKRQDRRHWQAMTAMVIIGIVTVVVSWLVSH